MVLVDEIPLLVMPDHDGISTVWVCELCGQPIGKDGRCNSAIHVGPDDGNAFNGHAIATTDLVAEYASALATIERYDAALLQCAEMAGVDTSDGAPTTPPIEQWAVECVKGLREEHDAVIKEVGRDVDDLDALLRAVDQFGTQATMWVTMSPAADALVRAANRIRR